METFLKKYREHNCRFKINHIFPSTVLLTFSVILHWINHVLFKMQCEQRLQKLLTELGTFEHLAAGSTVTKIVVLLLYRWFYSGKWIMYKHCQPKFICIKICANLDYGLDLESIDLLWCPWESFPWYQCTWKQLFDQYQSNYYYNIYS